MSFTRSLIFGLIIILTCAIFRTSLASQGVTRLGTDGCAKGLGAQAGNQPGSDGRAAGRGAQGSYQRSQDGCEAGLGAQAGHRQGPQDPR